MMKGRGANEGIKTEFRGGGSRKGREVFDPISALEEGREK